MLIVCCLLAGGAVVGAAELTQRLSGHKYIVMAEEALAANESEKAAEYLEEIKPKSRYYTQARSILNDIYTAKRHDEDIKMIRENFKSHSSEINVPTTKEIYGNTQEELAEYLQKLVDAKEYTQALEIISKLDPSLKNDKIEEIEQKIREETETAAQ